MKQGKYKRTTKEAIPGKPDRVIGVEGRRKAWNNWELMKYYSHKAAAGSSNDLKRYDWLSVLRKHWEGVQ
jgi:hypothetical protein